jgi:AraC-like DNA-binding protein
MQFQSKTELSGNYAPIKLDLDFPVAGPDFTLRSETPTIPPHVHDCFELGYCYEGSGVFIVENKILSFSKGDSVVINSREIHIMRGNPGSVTKWEFINLAPELLLASYVPADERFIETWSLSGPKFNNIFSGNEFPEICLDIKSIINEVKEKKDGYRSAVRAMVWSLMVKLHRAYAEEEEKESKAPDRKKLARISPAMEYIADNYSEPIEVEELAALCKSSVPNFRKLFVSATGISPLAYIKDIRMKVALSLLKNTKLSILEIALRSGFPTLSNFNRQFKAYYGKSPKKARKE